MEKGLKKGTVIESSPFQMPDTGKWYRTREEVIIDKDSLKDITVSTLTKLAEQGTVRKPTPTTEVYDAFTPERRKLLRNVMKHMNDRELNQLVNYAREAFTDISKQTLIEIDMSTQNEQVVKTQYNFHEKFLVRGELPMDRLFGYLRSKAADLVADEFESGLRVPLFVDPKEPTYMGNFANVPSHKGLSSSTAGVRAKYDFSTVLHEIDNSKHWPTIRDMRAITSKLYDSRPDLFAKFADELKPEMQIKTFVYQENDDYGYIKATGYILEEMTPEGFQTVQNYAELIKLPASEWPAPEQEDVSEQVDDKAPETLETNNTDPVGDGGEM